MKLQLALDDITLDEAQKLLSEVIEYIDIIEVGTPMIYEYGLDAIRQIRNSFKDACINADFKIMDAGYYEASQAFKATGNIVTVMALAHDVTIKGAVKSAAEFGQKVMGDMMLVEDILRRGKEIVNLGVDYVCIHTAVDIQDFESPYEDLALLRKEAPEIKCVIAGGINSQTIKNVIGLKPEIVIVGSGITKAKNPKIEAKTISNLLKF